MNLNDSFILPRGFLPSKDPLTNLPSVFSAWEQFASEIPHFLLSDCYTKQVRQLPAFPVNQLTTPEQWERAMVILSYIGQAYVWSDLNQPENLIPEILAVPWYQVALHLNRPPILSYASYALYNWRRLDLNKNIELGNIVLLQNFLGGLDEEWFVLVHVQIEAEAAIGINAFTHAFNAISIDDIKELYKQLQIIEQSLQRMCGVLKRMPERCDPYIYYNRVRPYIHGWKNNPALPEGVIYQGVEDYQNQPVKFKGETGAQSSIIPVMDGFFGLQHGDDPLQQHLIEMKAYMPPSHREFISFISSQSQVRPFIEKNKDLSPQLADIYNACLELLHEFRATHLSYAAHYIQKQNKSSGGNPTDVGTGGTPFMDYLKLHLEETRRYFL